MDSSAVGCCTPEGSNTTRARLISSKTLLRESIQGLLARSTSRQLFHRYGLPLAIFTIVMTPRSNGALLPVPEEAWLNIYWPLRAFRSSGALQKPRQISLRIMRNMR
jgi:hypothetical protein